VAARGIGAGAEYQRHSRNLSLALEYELPGPALRAAGNLGDLLNRRDRCQEAAVELEEGIALARRVGDRALERRLLGELSWSLALTGRWEEALDSLAHVPEERLAETLAPFQLALLEPLVARGALPEARNLLSLHARWEDSPDVQERTSYRAAEAVVLRAEGKEREALAAAEDALAAIEGTGPASQEVKVAFPPALEAALALGEHEQAERLLKQIEKLPPGRLAPLLRAQVLRFRARLAAAEGEHAKAEGGFKGAESSFREFNMPFWLAVTQVEHSQWLASGDRANEAQPLLAEARETFERLEAKPWLERLDAIQAGARAEIPA